MGGRCHVPATLPPGKRPDIHCIGVWVDPRADLDRYGKFDPRTIKPIACRYNQPTVTSKENSGYLTGPHKSLMKMLRNAPVTDSCGTPDNTMCGKEALCSDGHQVFFRSSNFGTNLCRQSTITVCLKSSSGRTGPDGINL